MALGPIIFTVSQPVTIHDLAACGSVACGRDFRCHLAPLLLVIEMGTDITEETEMNTSDCRPFSRSTQSTHEIA